MTLEAFAEIKASEGGIPLGAGLAAETREIKGGDAREGQITVPERDLVGWADLGMINALVAALGRGIEAA